MLADMEKNNLLRENPKSRRGRPSPEKKCIENLRVGHLEEEGSPGVQALGLSGNGEAHPLVADVEDGIVGAEEDVPEDPQRLATARGQVGGLDSNGTNAISLHRRATHIPSLTHGQVPEPRRPEAQTQKRASHTFCP